MALSVTNAIEGVNGGGYQRLYIPAGLSGDSQYPFRVHQDVRLELVETTCERHALVILPTPLEVDREATEIGLQVADTIQASLEEVGDP